MLRYDAAKIIAQVGRNWCASKNNFLTLSLKILVLTTQNKKFDLPTLAITILIRILHVYELLQ
jgi:hypothetical protein